MPHGGFIVLPVVSGRILFVVAILVGSLATAVVLGLLRKDATENTESK